MKNLFLIFLMALSYSSAAQQKKPPSNPGVPPLKKTAKPESKSKSEPEQPNILREEALLFLKEFEDIVSFLARKDPKYTNDAKFMIAEAFAAKFREKAIIEVLNPAGKLKKYVPIDYFRKLINLNYDEVTISFKTITGGTKFQPLPKKGQWKTLYMIGQTSKCVKEGKVIVADYTIKTIDLYFLHAAGANSWTKFYGDVRAESSYDIRD
jgi:hypothetical protein